MCGKLLFDRRMIDRRLTDRKLTDGWLNDRRLSAGRPSFLLCGNDVNFRKLLWNIFHFQEWRNLPAKFYKFWKTRSFLLNEIFWYFPIGRSANLSDKFPYNEGRKLVLIANAKYTSDSKMSKNFDSRRNFSLCRTCKT